MNYQIVENDNNQVLLYVLLASVIFFLFILPKIEKCNKKEEEIVMEKMSNAQEKILKIDKKNRKENCSIYTQWTPGPAAAQLKKHKGTVSNNFLSGTNRLCYTDKDKHYLANKAGNAAQSDMMRTYNSDDES